MNYYTKLSGCLMGSLNKFLLVMRLMIILFFVGMMQVSGATYGQKITLNQNKIKITQLFKEIKRQTGYDVLWQSEKLNENRIISANFNKTDLKEVMTQCLAGQNVTFAIEDNSVVIKQQLAVIYPVKTLVQDSIVFKGRVLDEHGKPLPGASIHLKGGHKSSISTESGYFERYGTTKSVLIISYLGYITKEVSLVGANPGEIITVKMNPQASIELGEVKIASNGYQDIPKERATGVFEVISKEQLQHSTDPNLLKRLEGITTSMDFRNDLNPTNSASSTFATFRSPLTNLTIRGKNTLTGALAGSDNNSGRVLVVIDGIASPYSIDQVNPNDVESVTILKDAAAASIWGSRAANGVIVVKTKKGSYQNPLQISFNANLNITEKPNLFYKKTMSVSDYIDAQVAKYNRDYPGPYNPNDQSTYMPDPQVNAAQTAVSPVADIANQERRGQITAAQANAQLDALRGNDVRNDLSKYFFRNSARQSYSLAVSGGSEKISQRFSANYDKTLNNTVKSGLNREGLNYAVSVKPLSKLELNANVVYSQTNTSAQSGYDSFSGGVNSAGGSIYPYTKLADDNGNPLVVSRAYTPQFLNLLSSTYGDHLLDYQYRPLKDINDGYNKSKLQNININFGATYQILPGFSANLTYNYNVGYGEANDLETQDSWYMRDQINLLTTPLNAYDLYTFLPIDPYVRHLPLGGQYTETTTKSNNQTLRGQLNFNKTWNEKHNISAIAGIDVFKSYSLLKSDGYLGYDPTNLSVSRNLNYDYSYLLLFGNPFTGAGTSKLPAPPFNLQEDRGRTISYFTNAAYTYDNRYTLSASFRRDLSNVFSSLGNNGGTPFYSVGAAWNINNEKFYNFSLIPLLKLRATFGYNGNVNPAASGLPVLQYTPASQVFDGNFLAFANAFNASNSNFRPEKTGIINLGLDFSIKGGRLSGNVEYYQKRTKDLLTSNSIDPSTGFSELTTNSGNLYGHGVDFTLNSLNIESGKFRWNSNFLFSYNKVKVTKLYSPINYNAGDIMSNPFAVTEGADLSRAFAYKWAGLDPQTGDPRGYLNGNIVTIDNTSAGSDAFNAIKALPTSSLHYFGSLVPVYYGSFRNTFSYGNFSLSANLQYKLGYWFRRPISDIVQYSLLYSDNRLQGAEYTNRWQKPGDEKNTNVPSLTFPISQARDGFYQLSDINILKGDHIRLQEINLSYTINKKNWVIKNPRIYANVSNLGVIWRANKLGLDPDIYDYPIPRTYSLGLSANF
ncbi:SusC/RagA family TonB-linked outer membrane protein [Pedobacter cryoconitis]|uniref:SusC/RagA family TonB-linked outer membrane protein n=1 Tax=Pedobacter cryoconitis TaxID=188932 RepID=UPI0016085423|nr:SusC/RagA family TonB-linked outer membrane protein [Pedobacter cryoconitis]MBB5646293.1 TonB-linked SusC/RagA family outer membrane protein [Pedobacter cryoconitis]